MATWEEYLVYGATVPASSIPVIDCHQHMWYPKKWHCPWLDGCGPELNKVFSMQDYQEAARGCNVVQTVFLETDAAPTDYTKETNFVLKLCADPNALVTGAVIGCRIDSDPAAFAKYMAPYAKVAEVKGCRHVLHASPEKFCLSPHAVDNVKHLGSLGKVFECCIRPTHLRSVVELSRRCPKTVLVLDHCGGIQGLPVPGQPDPDGKRAAWKLYITELGKCPNVVAKLSGLYGCWAGGMKGWSFESQADDMAFVLAAFPSDRVVFGGDWPVLLGSGTLHDFISAFKTWVLRTRGVRYARALFHDNAKRVYNLK